MHWSWVEKPFFEMADVEDEAWRALLWLTGARLPLPSAITPAQVDWQRLIQLAYVQRMLPLLSDRIIGHLQALQGYEEHIRLLRKAQLDVVRRNLALAAETLRLLDALEASGIQTLPFKGCVLCMEVYSNLSARKDGDIDLLVRQDHVWKALEVLAKCGYRPYKERTKAEASGHLHDDCEWELLNADKRMGVDLHWSFNSRNAGLPMPGFLNQLWSRRGQLAFCGRSIHTFGTEDLVFMLTIHAAKHHWQRLEWIYTLARVLNRSPEIDWSELYKTARDCHAERLLNSGLAICSTVYDVALPADILQKLQSDQKASSLAGRAMGWLFQGKSDTLSSTALRKFSVDAREGLFNKVYYVICATATPSAKDYIIQLPFWLRGGYYIIRLARLLMINLRHGLPGAAKPAPTPPVQWIPEPEVLRLAGQPHP